MVTKVGVSQTTSSKLFSSFFLAANVCSKDHEKAQYSQASKQASFSYKSSKLSKQIGEEKKRHLSLLRQEVSKTSTLKPRFSLRQCNFKLFYVFFYTSVVKYWVSCAPQHNCGETDFSPNRLLNNSRQPCYSVIQE